MIRVRGVAERWPGWVDAMAARRGVAGVLVVAAGVIAVRGDPAERRVEVVVAAREMPPGHVLEAADLRVVGRAADSLPGGVVRQVGAAIGATLAGAVTEGEMVTDVRVVGTRLAGVAAGDGDGRIVPIRLADKAVAEVLRGGDRVDVVAGEEGGGRGARLLASDAVVVLVSGVGSERGEPERVVLVALDARRAAVVAAASLRSALTVVFH
ncbi:SAF domain-containing protein [Nocardia yamanashiensis]|uniref:SAF domain-containing protein n=1 Tax=Nocardia yamanashiensis TaxID=209247 RepID=UPI001E37B0AE|nr:SAF domain-containing protein [Nocardia yamanashiensis]UGT38996.1 SAF domain-containing protein [Nocardia yamanashiensis]